MEAVMDTVENNLVAHVIVTSTAMALEIVATTRLIYVESENLFPDPVLVSFSVLL